MDGVEIYSPEPGDIVRDKKTGEDYVVYTVGGIALGGLALSALSLQDKTLREWREHEFADLHILKRNVNNTPPHDVIKHVNDIFSEAEKTASKMGLKSDIYGPEGKFLRNLLLIGDDIEKFDGAILDLSNGLVGMSGRSWSTTDIFTQLRPHVAKKGVTDETLWEFAEQLSAHTKVTGSNNAPVTKYAASHLPDIMLPGEGTEFDQTPLRLLNKAQKLYDRTKSRAPQFSSDRRLTQLGQYLKGGDIDVNQYLGLEGRILQDNAIKYLEKGLSIANNKSIHTEALSTSPIVRNLLKGALREIQNGKVGPNFTALKRSIPQLDEVFQQIQGKSQSGYGYRHRVARQSKMFTQAGYPNSTGYTMSQLKEFSKNKNRILGMSRQTFAMNYLPKGAKVRLRSDGRVFDTRLEVDRLDLQKEMELIPDRHFMMNAGDLYKMARGKESDLIDISGMIVQSEKLVNTMRLNSGLGSDYMTGILATGGHTHVHFEDRTRSLSDEQKAQLYRLKNADYEEFANHLPATDSGHVRLYIASNQGRIRHSESLRGLEGEIPLDSKVKYGYMDVNPEQYADIKLGRISEHMPLVKDIVPGSMYNNNTGASSLKLLAEQIETKAESGVTAMQTLGESGKVREAAFRQGIYGAKMAFASHKKGSNYMALSTNIGDVEQQLELGNKSLHWREQNVRVGLLDIETTFDSHQHLRETSLIDVRDIEGLQQEVQEMVDISTNNPAGVKDAIKAKAREIRKKQKHSDFVFDEFNHHSASTNPLHLRTKIKGLVYEMEKYDVIQTHTANDYDFLINEIERDSTGFQEAEKTMLVSRLKRIRATKGFDTTLVPQIATKGSVRSTAQNVLTNIEFGRDETHVSLMDNIDQYLLQRQYQSRWDGTMKNLKVFDGKKSTFITLGKNARSFGMSGETIQVVGTRSLPNGQVEMTYRNSNGTVGYMTRNPASMRDLLKGTNIRTGRNNSFSKVEANLDQETRQLRADSIEEIAKRMVRDLNPTNKTMEFPFSKANLPQTHRASHSIKVRYLADKLLGSEEWQNKANEMNHQTFHSLTEQIKEFAQDDDRLGKLMAPFLQQEDMGYNDKEMKAQLLEHVAEQGAYSMVVPQYGEATHKYIEALSHNDQKLIRMAFHQEEGHRLDAIMLSVLHSSESTTKLTDGLYYNLGIHDVAGNVTDSRLSISNVFPEEYDFQKTIGSFLKNMNAYAERGNEHAKEFYDHFGLKIQPTPTDILGNYRSGNTHEYFRTLEDSGFDHQINKFVQHDDAIGIITNSFKELAAAKDNPELAELHASMVTSLQELKDRTGTNRQISLGDVDHTMRKTMKAWHGNDPTKLSMLQREYEEFQDLKTLSDSETMNKILGNVTNKLNIEGETWKAIMDGIGTYTDKGYVPYDKGYSAHKGEIEESLIRFLELNSTRKKFIPPMNPGAVPENLVQTQQAMVTGAMSAGAQGTTGKTATAEVGRDIVSSSKSLPGMMPLMALAAGLFALGTAQPDTSKHYTAGSESDDSKGLNDLNAISEIPGGKGMVVFAGQEAPFKLDINIKTFVESEQKKNEIVSKVFDTITNKMVFKKSELGVRKDFNPSKDRNDTRKMYNQAV